MFDPRNLSSDVRPDQISDVDTRFGSFKQIVGSDVPAPSQDDARQNIEDLVSKHLKATGQSEEDFFGRLHGRSGLGTEE